MEKTRFYKVEIAEKRVSPEGQIESGDTIDWAEFKTLKQAQAYCIKALKKANAWSAWIHLYDYSQTNDFIIQWSKYKHKTTWSRFDH